MSVSKHLRELIALPSINPAFPALDPSLTGERRVCDYLAGLGAKAGLDVEYQTVFPNRRNILITLEPRARCTQHILLAPHMDTVSVPDQALLKPKIVNGRIVGRGACDTKGSIAAMWTALATLAKSRNRPASTRITLAALVDEENAQSGSRALAKILPAADLAIIGEPTALKVVTSHKGDLWLKLSTAGKAAHGSSPHLGENAVLTMARVVQALETKYAAFLRRRKHSLLGCPTINVGAIHGGAQANIVPASCEIVIDRRTIPGEVDAKVCQEIVSFLKAEGLTVTLHNNKNEPCLPLQTNPELPLVKAFLQHTGQTSTIGVNFFCDAAIIATNGTPCVVFGPGDIAQAHTSDEWIAIDSLEQGTRMLTRFLASLP